MRKLLLILALASSAHAQSLLLASKAATASFIITDLPGLKGWYTSRLGGNCAGACSDGNDQTSYVDQSGNSNNATVAAGVCSALLPPVYHTNQINSQPATTFDGSMNCLGLASSINLTTASTVCAVVKLASTAAMSTFFSGTSSGSLAYTLAHSGKMQDGIKVGIDYLGPGTASQDTSWHQMCMTYDGTTANFYLDGVADGSVAAGKGAITANSNTIGKNGSGGEYLNGQLAELIVCDQVLSGTNLTNIKNYWHGIYNL